MHLLRGKTNINDLPAVTSSRSLGLDWYGQTVASLCWITSVFIYGIDGAGDVLQLFAASAWLTANISVAARDWK